MLYSINAESWENNNEMIVIMNSMEIIEIIKLSNLESDRITNNIVCPRVSNRRLGHFNVRILPALAQIQRYLFGMYA